MRREYICRPLILLAALAALPADAETVTTTTSDDVTIHGDTWFGDLDESTPLILLFHQGGGNARGEYADIAAWLNENGYRAIAWDLRSGGDRFESTNRTVDNLAPEVSTDYCDGYPDLEAALDYVVDNDLAETIVAWGSSYSGALVFRLAASRSEEVDAVIAFSPAAGGPMQDCRAARWLDDVVGPMAVFTPEREMEHPHVVHQATQLAMADARNHIVENGVHGSSMLVDDRTQHDMSCTRGQVLDWLRKVSGSGEDR